MKRTMLMLLATASLLLGAIGCTSVGPNGQPLTFDQQVATHQVQIQGAATMVTRVALLTVADKDRAAATKEVHDVAASVQQALDTQNPDVTQLGTVIENLIASSPGKYTAVIQTVFEASQAIVNAQLQTAYANTSSDKMATATLQLVRAIVSGVLAATDGGGPAPATQPSADLRMPMSAPSPFATPLRFT